jgi:hypothetical protein
MSPLPLRTFMVTFVEFATYYDYVLAATAEEAITKAKAMYAMNGVGEFFPGSVQDEEWTAEEVQS